MAAVQAICERRNRRQHWYHDHAGATARRLPDRRRACQHVQRARRQRFKIAPRCLWPDRAFVPSAVQPMDLVKTRVQIGNEGMVTTARGIVAVEGVRGGGDGA